MKKKLTVVIRVSIILMVSLFLLSGCAAFQDMLDDLLDIESPSDEKKDDDDKQVAPSQKPIVLCTYFHYFKSGPEDFDQWWIHGKDPNNIRGPEPWRRDIWVGREGDYPYIGIYNNVNDGEIMRWHIRLAKAAGISAFLIYVNNWQNERPQTDLLLAIAEQEDFKIGFIEHHSFLGARAIRTLEGRSQPLLPQKYVGYEEIIKEQSRRIGTSIPSTLSKYNRPMPRGLRNVPADAIQRAKDRISGMLNQWKSYPAYLRIDGKPIIVIPYMVAGLEAHEFEQLVDMITGQVGEELYVVAIVPPVYWYYAPEAVLGTGITQEWADTGASSFTHWTPNGMITASQSLRKKVTRYNVKDSLKWKKDAMIPVMPGFDDDVWRPGDVPAPTAPRRNGDAWKEQLEAAFSAKPRFLFIQGWNEWHEGAQIEPSTHYSDPYLYLKILSQKLNKPWQTPSLPPRDRVDSIRQGYLPY
ncbi:hypothetical protein CSA56_12350 [candidate division KSB3 bacterium]|uniref:Glycoside hydrolase family 42 N-terminal domain-containing protein n=1 Tax=candidate division KSB3 bacterium TaxID=2044937 RepID=A0A2G6KC70_9BACT|nr:MAG: hypothetical protein CSA56_12350 [candidate division KSB3 bacterium]